MKIEIGHHRHLSTWHVYIEVGGMYFWSDCEFSSPEKALESCRALKKELGIKDEGTVAERPHRYEAKTFEVHAICRICGQHKTHWVHGSGHP